MVSVWRTLYPLMVNREGFDNDPIDMFDHTLTGLFSDGTATYDYEYRD